MDDVKQQSGQSHAFNILLVEDSPLDQALVEAMLEQAFSVNYQLESITHYRDIEPKLCNKNSINMLILDMNLPDRSGVRNVSDIAQAHPHLPIIVLTGDRNSETALQSLKNGAQDFLNKNDVTPDSLAKSLRYAQERKNIEQQLTSALGELERRNHELEVLAQRDALTGLPNRAFFQELATIRLSEAAASNTIIGLLFLDLNGFKQINDTYGHATGDQLLQAVAQRIQSQVRENDFAARLGCDEFVILTEGLETKRCIEPITQRLMQAFSAPFIIDGHDLHVTPSVGVAFHPDAHRLEELLKHADAAMYEAKASKLSGAYIYNKELNSKFSRMNEIGDRLKDALKKHELSVSFQPVSAVAAPHTIYMESLIRWNSPDLGKVSPDEFIDIAENTPVINDITQEVMRYSAATVKRLAENNLEHLLEKISINICASQLDDENFYARFIHWARVANMPLSKICIEITERQLIEKTELCKLHFSKLKKMGVSIALDDFGTGYSSLTHLVELDIDILKIDRRLIANIDTNPDHAALVAGITEMAHRMGITVIAEGIERIEEYRLLAGINCDFLQGFFIEKPLNQDDLINFYQRYSQPH